MPDPPPPPDERDDREDFGSVWVPLPALGARVDLYPAAGLHLSLEALGTHVENFPTWHTSGGHMRYWQTSLDAALQLGYRVHAVEFGVSARYRLFYIEQQSRKDGNEFTVHGWQAGLYIRVAI